VFNWEPLKWSTGYEFQLAKDAAFKSLILNLTGDKALGNVTSYQLTEALAYSTTCYWRVRGISATGSSDWSAGVGFTTMAEPVEALPPVVVEEYQPPDIIVEVPPAPAPVSPGWIWAIVIISAVLVIAVIVLIVRTRRSI